MGTMPPQGTTISGPPGGLLPVWRRHVARAGIVFLIIFIAALFGIFTRPVGFLAAVWPANAILLGLMLRWKGMAGPAGWVGAAAGYVLADCLTGSPLDVSLWMTVANMAGVAVGVLLLRRLTPAQLALTRSSGVVALAGTALAVATVGAGLGCQAEAVLFGRSPVEAFGNWFGADLLNVMAILPVILTMPERLGAPSVPPALPPRPERRRRPPIQHPAETDPWRWAPAAALALSLLATVLVGGAGALTFPVPALLWCALRYRPFGTAVLVLVSALAMVLMVSAGHVHLAPAIPREDMISIRIGITLTALAPLTVVAVTASREELMGRLHHAATHDGLTGTLARAAFMEKARALTDRLAGEGRPAAVITVDADHFKRVNDNWGHPAGDRVLARLAGVMQGSLRREDLLGRIGGEEFAVLLADVDGVEARRIAVRLLDAIRSVEVPLGPGDEAYCGSASLGVALVTPDGTGLEAALAAADRAMYRAKQNGRNRVEMA